MFILDLGLDRTRKGGDVLVAVANEEIWLDSSKMSEVNVSWAISAFVLHIYQDINNLPIKDREHHWN